MEADDVTETVEDYDRRVREELALACGNSRDSFLLPFPEYQFALHGPASKVKESLRHPSSQRFHDLLKELGDLHDKKQGDYGRANDPFANVRASTEWGMPAWVGAMVRANDKMRRLQALQQKGKLENESAADSLKDLAVYALIALVLMEEEQKGGTA